MLTPKLERGYTSAQEWTPGRGGVIQLSEIKVRENETFESALRRFNKKIKQNGVLSEVRRREHYEKPSVKRKKKIAAARKRRGRPTAMHPPTSRWDTSGPTSDRGSPPPAPPPPPPSPLPPGPRP